MCCALSFDYGQRHRHELAAAQAVARQLGAERHVTVQLDLRAIGGSALTDNLSVPHAPTTGIPITYVPARNLTFLSVATGYAEVLGARDVFLGVNAVDYSGYPDCRRAFIESFQRTANLGTKAGVESAERGDLEPWLRVHTPLVEMTKAEIIRAGGRLGVDFALTHSCYDPIERGDGCVLACGTCDSCRIRREGFHAAGVPDPTRYAPPQT